MLPWTDLVAPLLAFAAGLPAVTLALVLWARTRDRSFELLATGLALLAASAFLLSVGVFLLAARVVANPDLRFVLWNTTFLISFVSLVVLRRFCSLVIPGPQAIRTFPRLFSVVSAGVYGLVLALAFAWEPPLIDFQGRAVYALSAVFYFAGAVGPVLRLWRARAVVPSWVARLLARGPWLVGPPGVALVVYEALRWAVPGAGAWPSLGPLAALPFFFLVTYELFSTLGGAPLAEAEAPAEAAVARVASRCVADPLTRRELDVLALVLEGWRNQDIADRLGLSPHTVKNHVYSLYQKTGAASRLELMALARGES